MVRMCGKFMLSCRKFVEIVHFLIQKLTDRLTNLTVVWKVQKTVRERSKFQQVMHIL